jgi:hypothetical protein
VLVAKKTQKEKWADAKRSIQQRRLREQEGQESTKNPGATTTLLADNISSQPKTKKPRREATYDERSSLSSAFKLIEANKCWSEDEDELKIVNQWQVREQVEFYLSDANLSRDDFYRTKIIESEKGNGWFDVKHIMTAPRIRSKCVDITEVVDALAESKLVETMKDDRSASTDVSRNRRDRRKSLREPRFWIRRRDGKAMPKLKRPSGTGRRKRSHSYDDDDIYGFGGGGCMGYSSYQCNSMLEYGVKPWDDDAGGVLGAMHGW